MDGIMPSIFIFTALKTAYMQQDLPKCFKRVGEQMVCPACKGLCIKYGRSAAGKQRYQCSGCKKTMINSYTNKACLTDTGFITALLKEGCGIRSISRLLKICTNTVLTRILAAAKRIDKPVIFLNKEYEIDELRTYCQKKSRLLWIVYALEKESRSVIDFAVGSRTMKTLQKVTDTVLLSGAKSIYTDKLNLYRYLLPGDVHFTNPYQTNHIERKNLSLRTDLKRLNRRTICFSKSITMLKACLSIYFWG